MKDNKAINNKLEFNLISAKRIIGSFSINAFEYTDATIEKVDGEGNTTISCKRNILVAECILAIDNLQTNL